MCVLSFFFFLSFFSLSFFLTTITHIVQNGSPLGVQTLFWHVSHNYLRGCDTMWTSDLTNFVSDLLSCPVHSTLKILVFSFSLHLIHIYAKRLKNHAKYLIFATAYLGHIMSEKFCKTTSQFQYSIGFVAWKTTTGPLWSTQWTQMAFKS
jgi:hypothetical protein